MVSTGPRNWRNIPSRVATPASYPPDIRVLTPCTNTSGMSAPRSAVTVGHAAASLVPVLRNVASSERADAVISQPGILMGLV